MSEGGRIRLVLSLRRAGIDDTAILSAIERLPREAFLPEARQERAWDDAIVGAAGGQLLTRPLHAATYLQALALGGRERVLQVPTATGYLTALCAEHCRWVYTVDSDRAVRKAADDRLRQLRRTNVVSRVGDPLAGWPEQAPFDRILLDQVVADIPTTLLAQLRDGGSLVFPRGEDKFATITKVTRAGDKNETESILRTSFAVPHARN